MATIGNALSSPEKGWKRYEIESPSIKLTKASRTLTSGSNVTGGVSYLFSTIESKAEFSFVGTKILIRIWLGPNSSGGRLLFSVNGVEEIVTINQNYSSYAVGFIKEGLVSGKHDVIIKSLDGVSKWIDTIDIDQDGRILHPNEVTDIKDLELGKRIRCHYAADSGAVGVFSNIGEETYKDGINDFLPASPIATPNGDFYFIMVDDYNEKKKLIADRNIQNYISWDTLNNAGMVFGKQFGKEKGTATLNSSIAINGNEATLKFPNILKGKTDFSFSVSIRTNQIVTHSYTYDDPTIFGLKQGSGISGDFNIVIRNGMVGVFEEISGGSSFNSTNKLVADNCWHNVTFVRKETNVSIYIDGEKLLTKTMPKTPLKDSEIFAGSCQWTAGAATYIGEMKDYLIYDSALTENDVQRISNGEKVINDNLIGYYRLNSLEIKDSSGKGNDGSYKGSVTLGIDDNRVLSRLMTGGVSSSDKDNEWDKYIINSDLNGTITPGDIDVWNIPGSRGSWTSTSANISNSRVRRGSANISEWYQMPTNSIRYYEGYRPVLEIEPLVSFKHLINKKGEYGYIKQGIGDAIPQMTSDTEPSGEAFASSYFVESEPYKAFNKTNILNSGDSWFSQYADGNSGNAFIGYDFKTPVQINKLMLVTENRTDAGGLKAAIDKFDFEGWNGNEWVLIQSVDYSSENVAIPLHEKEININSSKFYSKYRLNKISSINARSGTYGVAIGEIHMYSDWIWMSLGKEIPTDEQFEQYGVEDLTEWLPFINAIQGEKKIITKASEPLSALTLKVIPPAQIVRQEDSISVTKDTLNKLTINEGNTKQLVRVAVKFPGVDDKLYSYKNKVWTFINDTNVIETFKTASNTIQEMNAADWQTSPLKSAIQFVYLLEMKTGYEDISLNTIDIELKGITSSSPIINQITSTIKTYTLNGYLKSIEEANAINLSKLEFKTDTVMSSKRNNMHDLVVDVLEENSLLVQVSKKSTSNLSFKDMGSGIKEVEIPQQKEILSISIKE